MSLQSIKAKGVGTNPRIFDNAVILAEMFPHFYYLVTAGWSHPYNTAQEAYDVASAIEDARKKADALKKKK